MANFVHNDGSHAMRGVKNPVHGNSVKNATFHGQPPIMLARLPHVGEVVAEPAALPVAAASKILSQPLPNQATAAPQQTVPPQTVPQQAVTSQPTTPQGMNHSAVVPAPESMPQLDLRTEIERRTQLHLAPTSRGVEGAHTVATQSNYFADRQHETTPAVRIYQQEAAYAAQAVKKSAVKKSSAEKSTSLGDKLSRLHAKLAPHAGLIVTFALVAAAGLLYQMMVGPAKVSDIDSPNYQPEYEQNALGSSEIRQLPHVVNSNTVEEKMAAEVQTEKNAAHRWVRIPLPPAKEAMAPRTSVAERPVALPPVGEGAAMRDHQFPTTSSPGALDFTKMNSGPAGDVARRPTNTTNR